MRLYWSTRSPFVRKVTITAHEKGLADRITLERVVVASSKPNPDVMRDNPTGKIPTLILDNGSALFDSHVICEYLDAIGTGPKLFPQGDSRWLVLRQHAIGDGLMETILLRMGERNRAEAMAMLMDMPAMYDGINIPVNEQNRAAWTALLMGAIKLNQKQGGAPANAENGDGNGHAEPQAAISR